MQLIQGAHIPIEWWRICRVRQIESTLDDFDIYSPQFRARFMATLAQMARHVETHWYPNGDYPRSYDSRMHLEHTEIPMRIKLTYTLFEYHEAATAPVGLRIVNR